MTQTFSTAQRLYRSRVNAWAAREISSRVDHGGHTYQADADSRATVAGWAAHLAAGGSLPEGFVWRTADNQDVPLTPAEVTALNAAFIHHAHTVRCTGWAIKQALDCTDSLEAAEALVSGIGA